MNNNRAIFNSLYPFATSRGDFESNQVNGNIGGGLGNGIASLFFNADYRNIVNSSVINATVGLDSSSNPITYQALATRFHNTGCEHRSPARLASEQQQYS